MKEINAEYFFRLFINEVYPERICEDGRTLLDIYKNGAEYTPVITKLINQLIEKIGYTHQNEYYRIDIIGWKSNCRFQDMKDDALKKELHLNAHLWDLKIAIEHENSLSDWTDEIIKLIHIKCPLKVIIGYNYCDRRDELEQDKLRFISKWMQHVEALKTGENKEEYLVIIGNAYNHKTGKSDYSKFNYKGYIYNWKLKEFELIY